MGEHGEMIQWGDLPPRNKAAVALMVFAVVAASVAVIALLGGGIRTSPELVPGSTFTARIIGIGTVSMPDMDDMAAAGLYLEMPDGDKVVVEYRGGKTAVEPRSLLWSERSWDSDNDQYRYAWRFGPEGMRVSVTLSEGKKPYAVSVTAVGD